MENQKEKPTRQIDTCYNFDKEIGCVQIDCRCEKEEPLYDYGWCKGNVVLPQEEPKQETLEAAAEECWLNDTMTYNDRISYLNGFKACAKWQQEHSCNYIKAEIELQIPRIAKLGINTTGQTFEQIVTSLIFKQERSYSEEEVLDLLYKRDLHIFNRNENKELELPVEWLKQFKK